MSELQLVLILYQTCAASSVLTTFVAALAQGGPVALVLVLALVWWWPGPRVLERRQATVAAAVAAALALVAVVVLATLVDRPRPFVALGVSPLFPHAADSSFPSDHTLLSVALATPLLLRRVGAGWLTLVLALGIGLARVAAAVHYPSDVLVSAAMAAVLGAVASWAVVGRFRALPVRGWVARWPVLRRLAPFVGPPTP